jgi:hypothetical protein
MSRVSGNHLLRDINVKFRIQSASERPLGTNGSGPNKPDLEARSGGSETQNF